MNILVVDDDADARTVTKLALEQGGYAVELATDGIDALEKMERLHPDLIISDILMPRMDGFALCRFCKADPRFSNVPFVFLTATYLDARDEELAGRLGVERFLIKPQTPEAVLDAVRNVLDKRRDAAEARRSDVAFTDQEFNTLHAEALCRKLEDKVKELEHAKQALERDIAARKQTEAALRRSEQRFRTLTTHAPVGIFQTDAEGKCTFVNKRWCEITGYSPADALRQWWAKHVHPDDLERVDAAWRAVAEPGRSWDLEYRFVTPAGKTRWVRGTMVALTDAGGRITGCLGTNEDISGRREIEEALRKSGDLFRGIFDNSPVGIELYDGNGSLVSINKTCLAIFGVTDIAAVQKFNLFDDPNLDEELKRDLRGGRTVEKEILFDFELVAKHGLYPTARTGQIVLDLFLAPLRPGAGDIDAGYVAHVRDITERKKAGEALKESENVLRALIDANPEAVSLLDADGIVLTCNEAVAGRLGKPRDAIIGTCLWDLLPPEVAAGRKMHIDELFRTGKPAQFVDFRSERVIENHCNPVLDAHGKVTACAVASFDITERVRSEKALQRQAQVLDQIQESVITTDLEGKISGWNKGAERMFFYTAEETLGRHVSLIYPEDAQAVLTQEVIAPLMAKGEHESEVRLRRKSGEEFYALVLLTLSRDERGDVVGMIGTSRDVTRRRQAEEELRNKNLLLDTVLQSIPDLVYFKDREGRFLYVNKVYELITGLRAEDVLGKTGRDILPPGLRESSAISDREVLEHGLAFRGEQVMVSSQGAHILDTIKNPLVDEGGEVRGLVGISRDITVRKRAEEALHASEKMLRDITDHVGEGIYVFDADGRITFMNPEAERLLGWTMEEMNDNGAHKLVHPRRPDGSKLPYAECPMHNVAKTGEPYVSFDEVFVRKDGTVFPIAVISTPIREGSRIAASVTAFRDITGQKRIEQEREQLITDLQQALAKVKQLSGLLPICASCKKIRDDQGYWTQIEAYVSRHSEAEFSHGLCPDCADKFYSKYNIKKD